MAEDKKNSLTFRRLSLDDENAYLDFLMKANTGQFNSYRYMVRDRVRSFWRWEYLSGPAVTGGGPLIWICSQRNSIVGQLCVMPVDVVIDGRQYKAGWCQDFMVLSEFRGMGIGHQLVQHVQKGTTDTLDILMAVIATERSSDIFKKSGFLEMGTIDRYIYPLNFSAISRRLFKTSVLSLPLGALLGGAFRCFTLFRNFRKNDDPKIVETRVFDEKFNAFWQGVSKKFKCAVKRDADALRWRFAPQAYWDYGILIAQAEDIIKGYAVLKKEGPNKPKSGALRVGIISDILFDPADKETGETLLSAALGKLRADFDLVRCDMLDPDIERLLKSGGFMKMKSNNKFLICPLKEELRDNNRAIRDRRNWHLAHSDSDMDLS